MTAHTSPKRLIVFCMLLFAIAHTANAQFSKVTISLTGNVTNAETGSPLHASVSFLDQSGKEANKVMSNASGVYYAVLKPGMQYTARITCSQYYTGNEAVSLPAAESHQDITRNFAMQPIKTGTVFFNGDCFDVGSVVPRNNAAGEIAQAGKKMALNDEIEVSVETFSDDASERDAPPPADQGTQRANAIKAILTSNGAPANRVTLNAHNPAPAGAEEESSSKKKKAKKKKPVKPAKSKRGKKNAVTTSLAAKATIMIIKIHSEDE